MLEKGLLTGAAIRLLGPRGTHAMRGLFLRAAREQIRAQPGDAIRARLEVARHAKLPVFIGEDLCPRWVAERGRVPHRVFLTTLPKAGTYMMAKMLSRFDLVDCHVHALRDHVVDQRFAPEASARLYPATLRRDIALADILNFIGPGQFAFGHIGLFEPAVRPLFAPFKVVMMYRNLRDAYPSLLRFFRDIRRDMPGFNAQLQDVENWADIVAWDMEKIGGNRALGFNHLIAWRNEPNALALKYEEIVGDYGRDVQLAAMRRLGDFLGVQYSVERLTDIANTVVGLPTVTKTDRRTQAAEYWSDEVEELFQRLGLAELNRQLGYNEA
jgi:hypothetical protein